MCVYANFCSLREGHAARLQSDFLQGGHEQWSNLLRCMRLWLPRDPCSDGESGDGVGLQVGRRAHAMLVGHMQRYVYSAMGALRWKRDVTEYADILRNSHSPTTNAQARRKPGLHQYHSPLVHS